MHLASLQGELAAARQGVVDKDKAMKELKVGAARTEDSADKYVKKLGEKAKDVLGAGDAVGAH